MPNAAASASIEEMVTSPTSSPVTITTVRSPNPSTYGQNVGFTITPTGISNPAIPTGTVTVADNGACTTACTGGATLGSPLTLTNGVATFQSAVLTGGPHKLVITYGGDQNFH